MLKIVLYTTGCPKCKILERKLNEKYIPYKVVNDVSIMQELGIQQAPMLGIENSLLDFSEAIAWVNKEEEEEA